MPPVRDATLDPQRADKLIKGAREKPVSFAFGLGATPEKSVLAADKVKPGKGLFEICKAEGCRKGAYGTVVFDGTSAVFSCEKVDIPSLAKAITGYFKANKIQLKVDVAAEDQPVEDVAPTDEDKDEPPKESAQSDEDEVPEGKIYEPDLIIRLIRSARDKARSFAFGTDGERAILAVHPRLDPKRMSQMVRSEGARRGVWGTVALDGPVAVFTCEMAPFPGVKKGIRQWFRDQRLTIKFRVQGPDGEFDDPEDAAQDAGALATRMAAIMPVLKERAAADPALRAVLRERYEAYEAAIKAGDIAAASAAFADLARQAEPSTQAGQPADEDDVAEAPLQQAQLRAADFDQILDDIETELETLRAYRPAGVPAWDPAAYKAAFPNLGGWEAQLGLLQGRKPTVAAAALQADLAALRAEMTPAKAMLRQVRAALGHPDPGATEPKNTPDHRLAVIKQVIANPDGTQQAAANDDVAFDALLGTQLGQGAALRTKLEGLIAKLSSAAAQFGAANPAWTELEAITDRATEGDVLPLPASAARQLELWASAVVDAEALARALKDLQETRTALRDALHVADRLLVQLPDSPERTALVDEAKRIGEEMPRVRSTAATCQALADAWRALVPGAEKLGKDVARLKKGTAADATLRADIEALFALCDALKAQESEIPVKAPGDTSWTDLRKYAGRPATAVDGLLTRTGTERVKLCNIVEKELAAAWKLKFRLLDNPGVANLVRDRLGGGADLPDGAEGQQFWKAVFARQYGVEIEIPSGLGMKKLPKLYELFARVPAGHVGHDMLTTLKYETTAGPAAYSKTGKRIVLAHVSKDLTVEQQNLFKYPVPGETDAVYYDYFNMITLHEIGHAADGKHSLMRVDSAGFGAWRVEELSAVIDAVAGAAATAVAVPAIAKADLLGPVRQFLLNGKLQKPVSAQAPMGNLLAHWDAIEGALARYRTMTLATTKNPWETPVEVAGGRCYHEGYPGRWFSYAKAERDGQEISKYQWRAPGEWFAELYAWYWFESDPLKRPARAAKLPAAVKDLIIA